MNKSLPLTIKGIKYTLRLMGAGGTAYLYKGLPDVTGSPAITVKILKHPYLSISRIYNRFTNEQRLVRTLEYPGMPRFIKAGGICQRPYYAYYYIAGDSLLTHIKPSHFKKNPINPADLIRQLLDYIKALHQAKPAIVHGDLSPENIILSDEEPTIIDFGSAQWLNSKGRIPDSRWVGKPSYLSPEQAQGNHWDTRSDLYQIGMLFYELLTQRKYNQGIDTNEKRVFAASPQKPDYSGIAFRYHGVLDALLNPLPLQRISSASEAIAIMDIAAQFDPD